MIAVFPWVVGAICAPCFWMVMRSIEMTGALRAKISAARIWTHDDHPMSVADIERDRDWQILVRAYYHDLARINREGVRFLLITITLFLGVLVMSLTVDRLSVVPTDDPGAALIGGPSGPVIEENTALVLQFGYCLIAVCWILYVFSCYYRNTQFRSSIEQVLDILDQKRKDREESKADKTP